MSNTLSKAQFNLVWGDYEGKGIEGRDTQWRLGRDRVREEAESAEDDMVGTVL